MAKAINLLYVHTEAIGYGRLGTHLAQELEKMDVTVFDILPGNDPRSQQVNPEGRNEGLGKVACWVSVPTHAHGWWKGQIPMMFTMWEATILPPSFREVFHEFDTIIVPSPQNVELFSKYHNNVRYNPLGVDPNVWHYKKRLPPESYFNFLVSGSGPRKGIDLVHRAFRKLWGRDGSWGDGPVPRLILKNMRGEDYYGDRVEMVTGRIPAEAEVALYESAHCYVQPSRGEGFGLQPLQAIAQGCPTILTSAHGHESYAHLGLGLSSKLEKAAYFIYGEAGEWWEPDFDELCDKMKHVYDNWEDERRAAQFSAQQVVTQGFTWSQCAERFLDIVGRDNLEHPANISSDWYAPQQQVFKIVVNRDWGCSIAGSDFQFKKGKEYWEVADVKRILFEADLLDPICLEGDDHGLMPDQTARLEAYSAKHERCQLCGQRLNQEEVLV